MCYNIYERLFGRTIHNPNNPGNETIFTSPPRNTPSELGSSNSFPLSYNHTQHHLRRVRDGYCYLLLFPPSLWNQAADILGPDPTLANVTTCYNYFGLHTDREVLATITNRSSSRVHLERSQTTTISLAALTGVFGRNCTIGRRYEMGTKTVIVFPKLTSFLQALMIASGIGMLVFVLNLGIELISDTWIMNRPVIGKVLQLVRYVHRTGTKWYILILFLTLLETGIRMLMGKYFTTEEGILSTNIKHLFKLIGMKHRGGEFPRVTTTEFEYDTCALKTLHRRYLSTNLIPYAHGLGLTIKGDDGNRILIATYDNIPAEFERTDEIMDKLGRIQIPNIDRTDNRILETHEYVVEMDNHESLPGFDFVCILNNLCPRLVITIVRPHMSVRISGRLSVETTEWLRSRAQGYELSKDMNDHSPHPLNSAIRAIMREAVTRQIPAGCKVLCVGSNPFMWPIDGYYHSLPNIDHKDAVRRSNQRNGIEAKAASGHRYEFTTKPLQSVKGRFDNMICIHSNYDIDIKTLFFNAFRVGAQNVYITTLMSLNLFTDEYGVLPSADMSFYKQLNTDGPSIIKFSHNNESESSYCHNWDNYREYFTTRTIAFPQHNKAYYGSVLLEIGECITLQFSLGPMPDTTKEVESDEESIDRESDEITPNQDQADTEGSEPISDIDINKKLNELTVSLPTIKLNNHFADQLRWISLDPIKPGLYPLQLQTRPLILISEALFSNTIATVQMMRNPVLPSLVNTLRTSIKGWEKSNFHPYTEDILLRFNDVESLIDTLRTIGILHKYINDSNTVEKDTLNIAEWSKGYLSSAMNMLDKAFNVSESYYKRLINNMTGTFESDREFKSAVKIINHKLVHADEDSDEFVNPYNYMLWSLSMSLGLKINSVNAFWELMNNMNANVPEQNNIRECINEFNRRVLAPIGRANYEVYDPYAFAGQNVERPAARADPANGRANAIAANANRTNLIELIARNAENHARIIALVKNYEFNEGMINPDDPEDNLAYASKGPNCLGRFTNVQNFDVVTEFFGLSSSQCALGVKYSSVHNNFLECIFKCPHMVIAHYGRYEYANVINAIFCKLNICIVYDNYYSWRCGDKVDQNDLIVLELSSEGFKRIVPPHPDSFVKLLNDSGYTDLTCDDIRCFMAVANCQPHMRSSKHDFFNVLNLSSLLLDNNGQNKFGAYTEFAVIHRLCAIKRAAVVHEDTIYVPPNYSMNNIRIYVVVVNGQVGLLTTPKFRQYMRLFKVRSIFDYTVNTL